ncbi:MAG: hypothetical protein AVDCRST_MAG53-1179, partial [uncultured Solirubrobacteraceae bacterium]
EHHAGSAFSARGRAGGRRRRAHAARAPADRAGGLARPPAALRRVRRPGRLRLSALGPSGRTDADRRRAADVRGGARARARAGGRLPGARLPPAGRRRRPALRDRRGRGTDGRRHPAALRRLAQLERARDGRGGGARHASEPQRALPRTGRVGPLDHALGRRAARRARRSARIRAGTRRAPAPARVGGARALPALRRAGRRAQPRVAVLLRRGLRRAARALPRRRSPGRRHRWPPAADRARRRPDRPHARRARRPTTRRRYPLARLPRAGGRPRRAKPGRLQLEPQLLAAGLATRRSRAPPDQGEGALVLEGDGAAALRRGALGARAALRPRSRRHPPARGRTRLVSEHRRDRPRPALRGVPHRRLRLAGLRGGGARAGRGLGHLPHRGPPAAAGRHLQRLGLHAASDPAADARCPDDVPRLRPARPDDGASRARGRPRGRPPGAGRAGGDDDPLPGVRRARPAHDVRPGARGVPGRAGAARALELRTYLGGRPGVARRGHLALRPGEERAPPRPAGHPVHRAPRPATRTAGGLPLRDQGGLLPAVLGGHGAHAADGRDSRACRVRLHPGQLRLRPRPVHHPRPRRPLVGRGVLPGHRLGDVRPHADGRPALRAGRGRRGGDRGGVRGRRGGLARRYPRTRGARPRPDEPRRRGGGRELVARRAARRRSPGGRADRPRVAALAAPAQDTLRGGGAPPGAGPQRPAGRAGTDAACTRALARRSAGRGGLCPQAPPGAVRRRSGGPHARGARRAARRARCGPRRPRPPAGLVGAAAPDGAAL